MDNFEFIKFRRKYLYTIVFHNINTMNDYINIDNNNNYIIYKCINKIINIEFYYGIMSSDEFLENSHRINKIDNELNSINNIIVNMRHQPIIKILN